MEAHAGHGGVRGAPLCAWQPGRRRQPGRGGGVGGQAELGRCSTENCGSASRAASPLRIYLSSGFRPAGFSAAGLVDGAGGCEGDAAGGRSPDGRGNSSGPGARGGVRDRWPFGRLLDEICPILRAAHQWRITESLPSGKAGPPCSLRSSSALRRIPSLSSGPIVSSRASCASMRGTPASSSRCRSRKSQ